MAQCLTSSPSAVVVSSASSMRRAMGWSTKKRDGKDAMQSPTSAPWTMRSTRCLADTAASSTMAAREFAHLQPDNAEIERAVLAQEVETLRNRIGLRQVDVSKECGVNASMLSQWMLGRYKGNVGRINGLMESWLIRRRGGKPMDKSFAIASATSSSPKLKRRLDDALDGSGKSGRKIVSALDLRQVYEYPKHPPPDTLLIPIRLDVDVEGYRYIDSFSWNLYEQDYTYETFAATLVRDLDLPECFHKRIAGSIEAQVEKSKRSLPWHQAVTSESLHPIFINIRLNDTLYMDRFEWDLSNPRNDPEAFAQQVCEELGLGGEFEAQISLSIREQLRDYSRLIREGLKDRVTRLPPVTVPFRDRNDAASWTPSVKYVLADDIVQLERDDFKRMKPYSQSTAVAPPAPTVPKPNRPPKPVNTFLMFCRQWRKPIMADNANTSAKDASKILGDMWQKLTDEERAAYIPLAEMENQRRLQEWRIKENMPDVAGAVAPTAVAVAVNGTAASVATGAAVLAPSIVQPSVVIGDEDEDDDDEEEEEEDDDDDDEDEDDDNDDDGNNTGDEAAVHELDQVDVLDLNELDDEDLDLSLLGGGL